MFLSTQDGLCSVRMVWEKHSVHCFESLAEVSCKGHVLLFIYGFQLCVESADHRVHETVSLNSRPVLYLV